MGESKESPLNILLMRESTMGFQHTKKKREVIGEGDFAGLASLTPAKKRFRKDP